MQDRACHVGESSLNILHHLNLSLLVTNGYLSNIAQSEVPIGQACERYESF